MKSFVLIFLVSILTVSAHARRGWPHREPAPKVAAEPAADAKDVQILRAMNGEKRVSFVEGSGMIVTKVLPEDTSGALHQRWIVRLSDGREMSAVYNTDMCPHVPIKVGDEVSMGGMFLWLGHHGMIHWLHHDPRGNRPAGYVELNGTFYCKSWR